MNSHTEEFNKGYIENPPEGMTSVYLRVSYFINIISH